MAKNAKIFIDGKDIGETVVSRPKFDGKELRLDLSFKPNWVGIWHLQALMADRVEKS